MGAMAAAVVGFVAGIAFAILVGQALNLDGGLWDVISLLIGFGGAVVAVRLLRLRTQPPRNSGHRHRHA
jgi:hypothetical protein